MPPTKATATYAYISALKLIPFVNWPPRPANELTKMNKALIAAVCFMSVHLNNKRTGDNMIPPPIPISPEIKPIAAPITNDKGMLDFLKSVICVFAKNKKRAIGISKSNPRIFLYTSASTVINPPTNAIGTEARAKGKNIFQLKCLPL